MFYIRICLIRLIRHFFVGPGRIPIFCVHFCSLNSSPLSVPEKRFVRLIRHLQFRWEFKQIKDLCMRIVAPRNLFIEVIHEVRSATQLPIEGTQKVFKVH